MKSDLYDRLPPFLDSLTIDCAATGSRVICKPPPSNADEDWVVLVKNVDLFSDKAVSDHQWRSSLGQDAQEYSHEFISLREPGSGPLNLIITEDDQFFDRFVAATQVAQRLNVTDKPDRVALFHAVLFAERCNEPETATPAPENPIA